MTASFRILIVFFFILPVWIFHTPAHGQGPVAQTSAPSVVLFDLPREISLCGERVPLERQDVWEYLDQIFISSVYNEAQVILWIKRAHRYFPYIENRLQERKMPDDLKYVVIVESALKTYATSSAKAVGPWQFMNGTAKRYGLRVDKWIDERRNFERSTDAALSYLSDLYKMFGKWNLAIAAYNCGENKMARCRIFQESDHFYDTDLPLETEAYIFRILAAKMILSNPEFYGYHIPETHRYPPLLYDQIDLSLSREISLMTIARAADVSFKTIKEMNPEFLQDSLPSGRFMLRIPKGQTQKFKDAFMKATAN